MTRSRLVVITAIVVILVPMIPLVGWAFSARWRYPALVPQQGSLRGIRLLAAPATDAVHGLVTSTLIGTTVALLSCLVALPAARAIGTRSFRGRRAAQLLLLAPVIVPALAVGLGIQVFFVRYRLADTTFGVVLVQLIPTVPYATALLSGAFANLDLDYERQARILGASAGRVLVSVTLPLIRPAVTLALLLTFLISWSDYVLTLLIGGGQVKTLPLLLFAAIDSSDTTVAAAMGLLIALPPLLLVAVSARVVGRAGAASIGMGRL